MRPVGAQLYVGRQESSSGPGRVGPTLHWLGAAVTTGLAALLLAAESALPASAAPAWAPTSFLPPTSLESAYITSVSCPSSGNCAAIGFYFDTAHRQRALVFSESAGRWATGLEPVLPSNTGATLSSELSSVSCASAGHCVAVGNYSDSSGTFHGLLLTETSGTWGTGVGPVLPSNTGANSAGGLSSVSCPSPGYCSAVGTYEDSSGNFQGLLLTETSGTWGTGLEAALPSNAGANPLVTLSSVSCASAGDCSAVGMYIDTSGFRPHGLLLTESAGTWGTGLDAVLPAKPNPVNPDVKLSSVSCPSPGYCGAVGSYIDAAGNMQGLLLSETAGRWGPGVEAALPANAAANPSVVLHAVSCSAIGYCCAVGNYGVANGGQGLLICESSTDWRAGVEAALPANAAANPSVDLTSVSCPSIGDCAAVGYYWDNSGLIGNTQGLLISESSSTWGAGVDPALPSNTATTSDSLLNSVSCASTGACTAVGDYQDSSNYFQGLALAGTLPVASLVFAGSLAYTNSGPVIAGSLRVTPPTGPIGSVTGTVAIPGLNGGLAAAKVAIALVHGQYVGHVTISDPGAHLSTVATVQTINPTRPGRGQVSGTATGTNGMVPYTLSFTL